MRWRGTIGPGRDTRLRWGLLVAMVGACCATLGTDPSVDPAQAHWSFRRRVRPPVPEVSPARPEVRNPIDAFLARAQEARGVSPQPEAAPATLLRRVYFDLIGLPPTSAEIEAFERDARPDRYERLVDRLLEDPRHGERWARHWMDIWRYSDWWGLGAELRNSQRHIWHWRDWIVESLNADASYAEMIRLMLAADESDPTDPQKLRATGFLARNYFLFNRNQWLDETVEHVGKAFLGLTLNCAKCHEHKYDPIPQADYYRFRAFFEPYHVRVDMVPDEADLTRDGIPRVFDGVPETPTYRFVRGDENQPDKSAIVTPGVPGFLSGLPLAIRPIPLPSAGWQPERQPWVLPAHLHAAAAKMKSATNALLAARRKATGPGTTASPQGPEVRLAERVLSAASADLTSVEARAAATRARWRRMDACGTPEATAREREEREAAGLAIHAERAARVARAELGLAQVETRLAEAAADKKAAIETELKAAREALEKAKSSGSAPIGATDSFTSLPGAAWTPTRFQSSTKDDPAVEFPATSTGRRSALAAWITDPANPLTARVAANHVWARHLGAPLAPNLFDLGRQGPAPMHPELLDWLASELVDHGWSLKHQHRLIVTSAAYRRSSAVSGGETNLAKDPENQLWWRRVPVRIESEAVRDALLELSGDLDRMIGGPPVAAAQQAESRRRSLYFFHSNNDRNLFLTTFDGAGVKECYRREQSIVPQQSLALLNSPLVEESAERIAASLSRGSLAGDDCAFATAAFRLVLGAPPNGAELAACLKAMETLAKLREVSPAARRVQLVWALLNHNDFVTLR